MVRPNYNLIRFIRRCVSQMKREYGGPITLYKLEDTTTNLATGVKTVSRTSTSITRAIVLPNRLSRELIQSISLISANKKVVQGGTFDAGTRTFIIDRRDAVGVELSKDDWIVYNDKRYDIKWIEEFEQGTAWIVNAREIESVIPAQDLPGKTNSYLLTLNDSAAYTLNKHWFMDITDALGISDVASYLLAKVHEESASNAMVLADAINMGWGGSANDAVSFSDVSSSVLDMPRAASSSMSLTDNVSEAWDIPRAASSSMSLTDNASNTVVPGVTGFVSTWNTAETGTSNNLQVTLPLESGGTYNFVVDWGDSSNSTVTLWTQNTHTYAISGNYTVTITGTINGFRFDNGGDKLKLSNIANWGPLRVGNNNGYFYGCSNMTCTATDTLDISQTTDMSIMFYGCSAFNQDISDWNTANTTNMAFMFRQASVFNQDIGSWNTSNVTNMFAMIRSTDDFNQDISSWDTANVTTMAYMFNDALAFNQDIGSWNTANVITMRRMFGTASVFDQDISSWNIENVANFIDFLENATLSTANYSKLLIDWDAQSVQSSLAFHGGNATYNVSGNVAREHLRTTDSWTFTDGGPA